GGTGGGSSVDSAAANIIDGEERSRAAFEPCGTRPGARGSHCDRATVDAVRRCARQPRLCELFAAVRTRGYLERKHRDLQGPRRNQGGDGESLQVRYARPERDVPPADEPDH